MLKRPALYSSGYDNVAVSQVTVVANERQPRAQPAATAWTPELEWKCVYLYPTEDVVKDGAEDSRVQQHLDLDERTVTSERYHP